MVRDEVFLTVGVGLLKLMDTPADHFQALVGGGIGVRVFLTDWISIRVDVRVIAATNRDLEQLIVDCEFREDLFYRLNVFPIDVPPLRERVEDIPVLVNDLILRIEHEKRGSVRLTPAAVTAAPAP